MSRFTALERIFRPDFQTGRQPGSAESSSKSLLWKIVLGLLAAVLPFLVMLTFTVNEKTKDIDFTAKEVMGTELLVITRQLSENMATWRGLTLLSENGLAPDSKAMADVHRKISQTFETWRRVNPTTGFSKNIAGKMATIEKGWGALLAGKMSPHDPTQPYVSQSDLVAELLRFNLDIANESNLITDPVLSSYYLMDLVVLTLPNFAERVEQWLGIKNFSGAISPMKHDGIHLQWELRNLFEKIKYGHEIVARERPDLLVQLSPAFVTLEERFEEFGSLIEEFADEAGNPAEIFSGVSRFSAAIYAYYDAANAALRHVLTGRIAEMKTRLWQTVWLACLAAVFLLLVGWRLLMTITRPLTVEIKQRQAKENELTASERKFRHYVQASADFFWESDADQRFTYISENVAKATGVPSKWFMGKSVKKVITGMASEKDLAKLDTAVARHHPFRRIAFALHRPGEAFLWMSLSGVPVFDEDGEFQGYRGTCSDISDYKEIQETLREEEQRARTIMRNVGEGIIAMDKGGIIQRINPAAEEIFGYRSGELLGQNISRLMPREIAVHHDGYLEKYLAGGRAKVVGTRGLEVNGLRKDRAEVPLLLSVRQMKIKGEISFIGAVRDITKEKKAERELITHRDHLAELVEERTAEIQRQAGKMAEALETEREMNQMQQEFVSMASHEFRTPLAIIDGAAQRIARRADRMAPEDLVERIGKIRSAVKRMTGLIERTLDASRFNAGRLELEPGDVDLKQLLIDICDRQREISTEHVIDVEVLNLPDLIVGDAKLLNQIFTNLLSNATKYSRDDPRVYVEAGTDGDEVVVAISDHGVGIPADELPRLFERFFRARTSIGIPGTGIGLNLVKQLVELHAGSVVLESEEGFGSIFTVRLPVRADIALRAENASEAVDPVKAA